MTITAHRRPNTNPPDSGSHPGGNHLKAEDIFTIFSLLEIIKKNNDKKLTHFEMGHK